MQALRIVEAFNPVDQVNACLCSALIPNLVHTFDFERLEEALHRSVVRRACSVPRQIDRLHRRGGVSDNSTAA
jgi:hypothetical protein